MDTPQNNSPNYDTILQQIQQEIESLKTKLMLKDSRMDLLATQLKDTQAELETTQIELEATHKYTDDLLVGSVAAFAMHNAPKGWLECNGAEVSRITYARLFQRISIQFGKGNGSTTFNLPDLRGVFVRGWDKLRKLDAERKFGSYQADQMQSHTHQDLGHSHGGSVSNAGNHNHGASVSSGGSHSHSYKAVTPGSSPTIRTYDKRRDRSSENSLLRYSHPNLLLDKETATKKSGPDSLLYSPTYLQPTDEYRSFSSIYKSFSERRKEYDSSFSWISTHPTGDHSHSLTINSAGSHTHDLSISTSKASLGSPIASGAGTVRHGSESRPQNVALLFCIKY